MKLRNLLKIAIVGVLAAMGALGLYRIIFPSMVLRLPISNDETLHEISVYFRVLEVNSRLNKEPMNCNTMTNTDSRLADQWQTGLRCSMEGGDISIVSAGADLKFNTEDDIIVRRNRK